LFNDTVVFVTFVLGWLCAQQWGGRVPAVCRIRCHSGIECHQVDSLDTRRCWAQASIPSHASSAQAWW